MLAAPLYNVPTTTNNPNTLLPHIRTQCSYLVEKEKWNRMNTSRIYLQLHFLVWKRLWFPRPSWLLLQYNTSISCFQNENVSSLGQSVPPHLVCRDIFRRKVWSMEAPGNTIISCKPPRRQICYMLQEKSGSCHAWREVWYIINNTRSYTLTLFRKERDKYMKVKFWMCTIYVLLHAHIY